MEFLQQVISDYVDCGEIIQSKDKLFLIAYYKNIGGYPDIAKNNVEVKNEDYFDINDQIYYYSRHLNKQSTIENNKLYNCAARIHMELLPSQRTFSCYTMNIIHSFVFSNIQEPCKVLISFEDKVLQYDIDKNNNIVTFKNPLPYLSLNKTPINIKFNKSKDEIISPTITVYGSYIMANDIYKEIMNIPDTQV